MIKPVRIPILILTIALASSFKSPSEYYAPLIMNTDTLSVLRARIDVLDRQTLALIGQREAIVKEIGLYKKTHNIPALQQARYDQIVKKNIAIGAKEGLSEKFVIELMKAIHQESLRIENAILK